MDARANLNKVPIDFRNSVMSSLNKVSCLKEFDEKKGYFNINCSFSSANNWVTIGFERTPKITDLRIFLQMAKHLDALLLYKGTQIIDENILEENKHI